MELFDLRRAANTPCANKRGGDVYLEDARLGILQCRAVTRCEAINWRTSANELPSDSRRRVDDEDRTYGQRLIFGCIEL
jgi:hypothetical protein